MQCMPGPLIPEHWNGQWADNNSKATFSKIWSLFPISSSDFFFAFRTWFQLLKNDLNSDRICIQCWQSVHQFHLFYLHIEAVHCKDEHTAQISIKTEDITIATSEQSTDTTAASLAEPEHIVKAEHSYSDDSDYMQDNESDGRPVNFKDNILTCSTYSLIQF